MGKKLTQKDFIQRVKIIHNNKYSYSKTEYISLRTVITIICPIHLEFLQLANSHIRGNGCEKCGRDKIKKTNEKFIAEAIKTHGLLYDYRKVNYKGTHKKVIINCKKHGDFEQSAKNHIKGAGCHKCSRITASEKTTKTTENFIIEANEVHNNKYFYKTANYTGALNKLEVECKEHGIFNQSASNHLSGAGCPLCVKQNTLSWSCSDYVKKAKGRECTFYVVRCYNNEEEFYKIGITMNTVKYRYSGKQMPYDYEIISETKGSAYVIWNMEVLEKRKLKKYHYAPKIYFKGSKTECFTKYN